MAPQFILWRVIRFTGLVLSLLTLAGPWGYDKIYVRTEFECQHPTIRLEGDFCGWLLSSFWSITEWVKIVYSLVRHDYSGGVEARDIGFFMALVCYHCGNYCPHY
jgi:hypothetical protein